MQVLLHGTAWIEGEVLDMEGMAGKGAGPEQGTLREYGVFDDSHISPAPAHLTFEEIASMPAGGGTAMNALFFGPTSLKPGMTVLTQGTGGVSGFAIQVPTHSLSLSYLPLHQLTPQ